MEKFCLALCLILTLSLKTLGESSNTLWNETNVDKLKNELLKDYDRLNRPENFETATNCQIGMTVIHMELDETKGVLETHAWMRMNWTDSKLKWDPAKHSNITQLNISPDEVWAPDVTVYNSAEPSIVDHFAKTNKIIYPLGMVLWVPTAKFLSYCKMDLKFWPFDEQKCEIKIGSWTFSALQLNLFKDNANPIDLKYYNSIEWEITSTSVERHETFYACCPEPYTDLTFYLNFKRRSPMFKAIAIVPAMVVVFMTLSSFWLPPQAGEKLLLNGLACIMVCLLLMYLSKLLPIMASTSPLIVTFYSNTLYLLCGSFVISVIVINLARNQKGRALPKSLKKTIVEGFLGKCLSASTTSDTNESIKEDQIEKALEENNINETPTAVAAAATANNTKSHLIQSEWIRLAVIIDRIAFIVYVIIFILMGFIYFI